MSMFKKIRHNPMDLIESWWPEADISHITYDPSMKRSDRDYWRIEQSGGDGTLLFSIEMLQRFLIPLVNKTSYSIKKIDDRKVVKDIRYTIGDIRHVIVFGKIKLRCGGVYPGQRERVRIPVKCEFIY